MQDAITSLVIRVVISCMMGSFIGDTFLLQHATRNKSSSHLFIAFFPRLPPGQDINMVKIPLNNTENVYFPPVRIVLTDNMKDIPTSEI